MNMQEEEAFQRLRAEILAQDWRLSSRRIEALFMAFDTLERVFEARKGPVYILGMARGALDYLKRRGDEALPAALDFLKEALAHLVSIYEDENMTAGREAELFNKAYERFNKLKERIKSGRAK